MKKLAGFLFLKLKDALEEWHNEHPGKEMSDEEIMDIYEEKAREVDEMDSWWHRYGKEDDDD